MRVFPNNVLASVKGLHYQRKTHYKIYRKSENGWKVIDNVNKTDVTDAIQNRKKLDDVRVQCDQKIAETEIRASNDEINQNQPNYRQNAMKIQMLSQPLYEQIFKNRPKNTLDEQKIRRFNNICT